MDYIVGRVYNIEYSRYNFNVLCRPSRCVSKVRREIEFKQKFTICLGYYTYYVAFNNSLQVQDLGGASFLPGGGGGRFYFESSFYSLRPVSFISLRPV